MLLSVVLLSYLVWSELPDVNTMVGSLIIIGSRLYVLCRSPSIIESLVKQSVEKSDHNEKMELAKASARRVSEVA